MFLSPVSDKPSLSSEEPIKCCCNSCQGYQGHFWTSLWTHLWILWPAVCQEWSGCTLRNTSPLQKNVVSHLAFLLVTMPGLSRACRLHQQSWQMRDIRSAEMLILGYSCVITKLECTVYAFHRHSSEHRNVYTINGTCRSVEQFSCCDSWWAKFKVCTCLIQFNTFQGKLTVGKKKQLWDLRLCRVLKYFSSFKFILSWIWSHTGFL